MHPLRAAIAQRPIAAYLAIAFAFSWTFTPLVSVSIMFGLIALFGPALAAVVVSWADGTLGEIRSRTTAWRQPASTYLAAFGIPFIVAGIGSLIMVLAGVIDWTGLGTISAVEVVIFILVIGEEIGWRGFLQPRLRARMGIVESGLAVGAVWVLWHLPIYLQATSPLADVAIFAWWVIPLAVVMGFVAERARYSVIVATVMHGAANIATPILLPDVDGQVVQLVTGSIYVALAAFVAIRVPAGGPTTMSVAIRRRIGAAA
ncbi:MAG: CPBP family intramembrane glutamic endopeptidase [Chloroflexota bacterium]